MTEKSPKTAVLLINLGSPDEPTASALKPYLREFLSDRRVVDLNPIFWADAAEFGYSASPQSQIRSALRAGMDERGRSA